MFIRIQKSSLQIVLVFSMIFLTPLAVLAYDVNEKLSIEGTLTGIYQYGDFDVKGLDNADRGAVILDLGLSFHPTEQDEFQITLSYAAGNGLNTINPFSLVPYADDLEDDLKDINGRNRDYLLEAWYKHTFKLSENASLGITGGIIDATAYLDDNSFANNETAQFMNDAFVNNPLANLPSYDIGGVAEFGISNLSVRGLFMSSKNDEDREYNYYALQLGYKVNSPLGEGNYRIYGFTTNDKFSTWDQTSAENLSGVGVSLDQQLGETVGVFARLGWQDDKAVIDHDAVYSAGLNINGKLWGRKKDEIGLGYAYLDGADRGDINNTKTFEAYVKFKTLKYSDITFDIQYISDNMKIDKDRHGVIYGVRVNAYF